MIARDDMSLNTVEKPGFKYFMKTITPLYKCPCRKSITNYLDQKFESIKLKLKINLKCQDFYSLTTDIWTESHTTKSYLGVTAHYIGRYIIKCHLIN